jgi:hypothetical protein
MARVVHSWPFLPDELPRVRLAALLVLQARHALAFDIMGRIGAALDVDPSGALILPDLLDFLVNTVVRRGRPDTI